MALWVDLFLQALLISVVTHGIYSESQRAKVLSCDFEQGLGPCGLVNNNGAAQFQIRERKGADAQNVPARDVEQGKMFLFRPMYHFFTQPAVSTVTNINFVPPGKYCARFWLFMATDKNNEFYVERNSLENPETFQELGKFVGNNAPAWAKKNISFNALESSFKIRLRLVVIPGSYSHESMFALDDLELEQGNCDEDGDCDFNVGSSGYCGWQSVIDDTVNMIWSNSKPTGGPVSTSGYIFFQGGRGSGNWVKSRAVLFSEDLDKDKARCMTFNYYFNSSGIAEIRIHQVETLMGKNVIWHHRGQLSDSEVVGNNGWRLARVPLQKTVCDVQPCSNTNKDFLIVIEARILREVNYQYYVAIDDVQFLHEEKEYVLIPASARPVDHEVEPPVEHATNVCNFDDDQMNEACGFEADENAPLQWHSRTGAEDEGSPSSMAPVFDHTTYEDIGQYLYFEQSSNLVTGDYARQISPIYQRDQPSDPRCIRFWYQLDTEIIWNDPLDLTGDFTVYVNASGNEQLRWSTREQFIWKTSEWKLGVLKEISNSTTFRIIFEAKLFYNKGHLMVALDDITVDNSECKELDCDFDEGMCGWHNYYNMNEPDAAFADLSWEYGDSSLTLPNGIADPFLEIHPRGLFVYVPIFSTTQARHQALLEHQEQMSAGRMVCLTFEFLVTSTNKVGTISIAEKHYDYLLGDYKYTEIWLSNGGSKAGMWQSGQIAITNIITSAHNDWTLLFQGRANPTNATLSDAQHLLAIDTIRHRVITDADVNSCPPIPKEAAVSITTPSPPVITTTPTTNVSTMVLLDCSFNTDWCGFTNTPGSKPEWRRLDQSDGPSYAWFVPFRTNDHNGDLFLYQEFQKSSQNRYATVASSNVSALNGHEEYCLRFWTFMETYQSEKFKIIRQEHPGKREIIMKEFMGDAVVNWTLESIDFSSKSDFQIVLSVDIPPNGDLIGILAVDELVLRRGLCSIDAPPSVETTDVTSTMASTLSFIPKTTTTLKPRSTTKIPGPATTKVAAITQTTIQAPNNQTTSQSVTSDSVHTISPGTNTCECPTENSLVVTEVIRIICRKGIISKDMIDPELSEALEFAYNGDNTVKCRNIVYQMHNWALKEVESLQKTADEDVRLSCRKGVLDLSSLTPDDSEATNFSFVISSSLRCHKVFSRFLQFVKKY